MEKYEQYRDQLIELAVFYAPKLLMAIIALVIGFWLVNMFRKGVAIYFERKDFDISLERFLLSFISVPLKIMVMISVAGMVGFEVTSFIAVLGAATLAIGMALSGTLSNFAGGVMLLLLRPFKVGDVIEAQGYTGKVEEVQIFATVLKTPDNKTIIIPNSPLSSGNIVNYSTEPTRRVDLVFGVGYEDDLKLAQQTIEAVIAKSDKVLQDPKPFVAISDLADSSVNFTVRLWAKSEDYWDLYFFMQSGVKQAFDERNISIPYPQRELHIVNQVES